MLLHADFLHIKSWLLLKIASFCCFFYYNSPSLRNIIIINYIVDIFLFTFFPKFTTKFFSQRNEASTFARKFASSWHQQTTITITVIISGGSFFHQISAAEFSNTDNIPSTIAIQLSKPRKGGSI